MWTALIIILWVLAVTATVLLALLAVPIRVECRASVGEVVRFRLGLRLLAGLGPRVGIADSDRPSRKARRPKKKKAKKDRSPHREPQRFLRPGLRLVSDILARLHVEKVALDVRFGADDPAETGQIFGGLAPLVYGTAGCRRLRLKVEPVFDGAVFDGHAAVDVSLTPLRLIPPFVRFGWSAFGPGR